MRLNPFRTKIRDCDDVVKVLQSYLDGEVDAKTALGVAGHLGKCELCCADADGYQVIKDALAKLRVDVGPSVGRLTEFVHNIDKVADGP